MIRVRDDLTSSIREDDSRIELVADPLHDRTDMIGVIEHFVEARRSTPVFTGISVMERQDSVTSRQIIWVPMEVHAEFDDHVKSEVGHLATDRCGHSLPNALPLGLERSNGGVRSNDRSPRY